MIAKSENDRERATMTIGHTDSNVQDLTSGVVAGTSGVNSLNCGYNVLDCCTSLKYL